MVSPNLLIPHVADTAEKAPVMNEQTDDLDNAMNSIVVIDVTAGGQIVVTDVQAKENILLRLTGAPGGAFELVMPIEQRLIAIHNQVSDGSTATIGVNVTDGTWATINALEKAFFHIDGENSTKLSTTIGTTLGIIEAISGMIETPTEKTYTLERNAKYAYDIDELTAICAAGDLDITIQIDGVTVTGLDKVNYTVSETTNAATALLSVAVGETVTMIVSDLNTDTAADFSFSLKTTRT